MVLLLRKSHLSHRANLFHLPLRRRQANMCVMAVELDSRNESIVRERKVRVSACDAKNRGVILFSPSHACNSLVVLSYVNKCAWRTTVVARHNTHYALLHSLRDFNVYRPDLSQVETITWNARLTFLCNVCTKASKFNRE